ncbi:MAG: hydroxymethylbilane synthase [Microbacter sp.]
MKKLIVATRPSLLAYTQTEQTVRKLEKLHPDITFEIVKFSTHGDRHVSQPLTTFGGTGVFVKELEDALLEGRADFAVHSLKDVPSQQPDSLILAAFPKREDPRDVMLWNDANCVRMDQLPAHLVIGTGSPRRMVQLRQIRPEALFKDLRGNIDTRLRKLHEGQYDAIVMAAAGLQRIGMTIPEETILPVEICIPAIGQGALAIECRRDDVETYEIVRSIHDVETEKTVIAERSYMETIGGGCKFPLAAYAFIDQQMIHMEAMAGDHHSGKMVRIARQADLDEAKTLGIEAALTIIQLAEQSGISLKN